MRAVAGPVLFVALGHRSMMWLFLYLFSGAVSELASLLFRRWTRSGDFSVGASGAISGVLAAIGQLRPQLARKMFGFAEVCQE